MTEIHPNDRPLYIISVAAELVKMHPQTLRLYERRGLVAPKRQGKNRLYSQHDIERLIYIQQLTQELGINLAGVEIIRLQNELEELKVYKEAELMAIGAKLNQLERLKTARQLDIRDIKQRILEQTAEELASAAEREASSGPGSSRDHALSGARGHVKVGRPQGCLELVGMGTVGSHGVVVKYK